MKKLVTGAARLAALALVPLSLIAQPQKADALLSFYIFEEGGATKIKTMGSFLNLPTPGIANYSGYCSASGLDLDDAYPSYLLTTGDGAICTVNLYPLVYDPANLPNPNNFGSGSISGGYSGANNSKYVGLFSWMGGDLTLRSDYASGASLDNEITFTGSPFPTTLTGSGLIGEWKIMNDANTSVLDRVKVYLSTPPGAASAPAPLPIAGGALAFGWSRKLRRRAGKDAFSLRG